MALRSGNIGINVNPLCLGHRGLDATIGYASDAAALAAWQGIAQRSNEPGLTPASNPPAGAYYYNNVTDRIRFADGSGNWDEYVPGAGAALSLDGAYDNGSTIALDADPITINDSQVDGGHTFDINKTGAGSGHIVNVDISAAFTGNVVDVQATAAWDGDVVNALFTNAAATAQGILLDSGAALLSTEGWGLRIVSSGVTTGAQVALTDSALATGDYLDITAATATGARMLDLNANSAMTVPLVDIDLGALGSGNVIDIAASAAWTGNYLQLDLTNAVAAAAINIVAAGVRTDSIFEITDSSSSDSPGFLYTLTAGGPPTAALIRIDSNGQAFAQAHIEILLDGSTGASSSAITVNEESAARTGYLVWLRHSGTGASQGLAIDSDGAGGTGNSLDIDIGAARSGHGVGIDFTAAGTGDALNIDMNAADVAASAIVVRQTGARAFTDSLVSVSTGTGVFTGPVVDLNIDGAGSGIVLDIDVGAVAHTGNIFDFATAGAWNADVLFINLTNANAASQVLVVPDDALNHSAAGWLIDVSNAGAGAGNWIDLDVDGASSGNILDITTGAVLFTGDAIAITFDAATVGARALDIDIGAGIRTVPAIDLDSASTGAESLVDIDASGIWTGALLAVASAGAGTGSMVLLEPAAAAVGATVLRADVLASVRTAPALDINSASTGAESLVDIDASGVWTGALIAVTSAGAGTGSLVQIQTSGAIGAAALDIDLTGIRTVPAIDIDSASTGAESIIDVRISAAYTGNVLDILMDNAAATAQAALIDTNVGFTNPLIQIVSDTGSPTAAILDITSTGVGAAGVAAILDVDHSGVLVDGSRAVRIVSTGSPAAADCHLVHLEQNTGAGVAGNHVLYINATGANVEGIRVDAGTVTFDETLTVGGVLTVGDATNGAALDPAGSAGLVYNGTVRPTKFVDLPLANAVSNGTGTAAEGAFQNMKAWALDAASVEGIRFAFVLPVDYATNTALDIDIYCSRAADAANDVVMRVDYTAGITTGGDLAVSLTAGTETTITTQIANLLTIASNANFTVAAAASLSAGRVVLIDIVRVGNAASGFDTLGVDLQVVGVRVNYTAALA